MNGFRTLAAQMQRHLLHCRLEDFVTQTTLEANRKKGQDERDWLDGLSAFSP
jgi:hypothetical protein